MRYGIYSTEQKNKINENETTTAIDNSFLLVLILFRYDKILNFWYCYSLATLSPSPPPLIATFNVPISARV
jgi:hypothetical protein